MSNEITVTTAAAVIPEVWRKIVLDAREARQVVLPRILNVSAEVKGKGDTVHIPVFPQTLSVNTVGSGGSLTNQAITHEDVELDVDQWKELTVEITDRAQTQSLIDLFANFAKEFGKKLASHLDNVILALYSGVTTNSVGGTSALDDDDITEAVRLLDDANVPEDDRTWAFAPIARRGLLRLDKFVLANKTGMAVGAQINGLMGDIYGAPAVVSSNVATASSQRKNLYFHKEAFAIAVQRNVRIQRLAKTQLSTPLVGDVLYGVKTVREGHACQVLTASS